MVPLSPNNDWRIAGKLSDVKTLWSDRSEAGATDEVLCEENMSIEIVIEDPHLMASSRDFVWLKEASFAGIQAELCNRRKQIED